MVHGHKRSQVSTSILACILIGSVSEPHGVIAYETKPMARPINSETSECSGDETFQAVRVLWEASEGDREQGDPNAGQPAPANIFTVIERKQILGRMPRQRSRELVSDQIVVVAVDKYGREKNRTLLPDPRVLRAESPSLTGELRGQIFYRPKVEFIVPLPNDPEIAKLYCYHPRWNGTAFTLDLLGAIPIE